MNERQIIDLTERMCGLGYICSYQGTQVFVREYEKLNKPEKVKVPQFVADWIEEARKSCINHLPTSSILISQMKKSVNGLCKNDHLI